METQDNIREYAAALRAEDFDGIECYLYVESIDDPLLQESAEHELATMAAATGYTKKRFMERLKRFRGSTAKKDQRKQSNNIQMKPECSIEAELPAAFELCGWTVNMAGVSRMTEKGPLIACGIPVLPVERLKDIETGEEKVKLRYMSGSEWQEVIIPNAEWGSTNKVISLANIGIPVTSCNAAAFVRYMTEVYTANIRTMPVRLSVSRCGWHRGYGFAPYCNQLVFDGERDFRQIIESVHSAGSMDAWTEAALLVRRSGPMGRLALAAAFASPLLGVIGGLPFVVHFWGNTGYGKTMACRMSASVFADPSNDAMYISSYNSTTVATELRAAFLHSLPVCIDELQMKGSAGARNFDNELYRMTQGIGKQRGAKTGGLQQTGSWRCVFVSNGEGKITSDNSGGGAVNRVIEYECSEKLCPDMVELYDVITHNYGHAGPLFVSCIEQEECKNEAKKRRDYYMKRLLETNTTEKQAAAAAVLLTADEIATKLLFNDGNGLTVEDLSEIVTTNADVDANTRALQAVINLFAGNKGKFIHEGESDTITAMRLEVWGKYDKERIYWRKDVLTSELYAQSFIPSAFFSWAKKNGIIQTDGDSKRYTKKTSLQGTNINSICILRAVLNKHDPVQHEKQYKQMTI